MKADRQSGNDAGEILVVEDSPTQALHLQHILERQGYRVSVAKSGLAALAMMSQRKPTIVISDIVMPAMDGYQLCRQIKANEQFKDIPVILVTTLSDPEDVIRGLECGADAFIMKPYDERYLLARLQYFLVNRHLRKEEKIQTGVEIVFTGQKHFITSDRLQILDLLLSVYENAVQKNRELVKT
jgi:DNA-binding response OmpR family regulator